MRPQALPFLTKQLLPFLVLFGFKKKKNWSLGKISLFELENLTPCASSSNSFFFSRERKLHIIILKIVEVFRVINSRIGINSFLNQKPDCTKTIPSLWNLESTLFTLELD
ncbi:hypothetical protein EUGRSUZ_G01291 [Eucalyptus grandis]|uniref:Uncharacterized protein n=2 Tax=Eucalyptus grandis TaxID=71139 RepID=A0ACC3K4R6_EUCGR|nr:hypothetical protein EUGRSUZ_G01291 [Eucalyptus grandis]